MNPRHPFPDHRLRVKVRELDEVEQLHGADQVEVLNAPACPLRLRQFPESRHIRVIERDDVRIGEQLASDLRPEERADVALLDFACLACPAIPKERRMYAESC